MKGEISMGSMISTATSPALMFSSSSSNISDKALLLQGFLHKEEQPKSYKPNLSPNKTQKSTYEDKQRKTTKPWIPFSKASFLTSNCADYLRELQLLGCHKIGPNTMIETQLQGTKVQLEEFRMSFVHKIINNERVKDAKAWNHGQIAFSVLSDFDLRHRLTTESIFGSEANGFMLAAVASTDFESGISWGLANSYKLYDKLTFSSRFTCDDYAGRRLSFQAIHKVNDKNIISPIYTITLGRQPQFGISWTYLLTGSMEESVDVKALCTKGRPISLNVKANAGEL